jgi:hypothetical protein
VVTHDQPPVFSHIRLYKKKLVFGGAGRGRIFAPVLPSNHREEV